MSTYSRGASHRPCISDNASSVSLVAAPTGVVVAVAKLAQLSSKHLQLLLSQYWRYAFPVCVQSSAKDHATCQTTSLQGLGCRLKKVASTPRLWMTLYMHSMVLERAAVKQAGKTALALWLRFVQAAEANKPLGEAAHQCSPIPLHACLQTADHMH